MLSDYDFAPSWKCDSAKRRGKVEFLDGNRVYSAITGQLIGWFYSPYEWSKDLLVGMGCDSSGHKYRSGYQAHLKSQILPPIYRKMVA